MQPGLTEVSCSVLHEVTTEKVVSKESDRPQKLKKKGGGQEGYWMFPSRFDSSWRLTLKYFYYTNKTKRNIPPTPFQLFSTLSFCSDCRFRGEPCATSCSARRGSSWTRRTTRRSRSSAATTTRTRRLAAGLGHRPRALGITRGGGDARRCEGRGGAALGAPAPPVGKDAEVEQGIW